MDKPNVIVDLDGTLSDHSHRVHLVTGKVKNYDEYYRRCVDDPLIESMACIVDGLYSLGHKIHLLTGRSDVVISETKEWLTKHDVPYHNLLMRRHKDFRKDTVLKEEMAKSLGLTSSNTLCAFDDRKRVVDLWRGMGIVCYHVGDGDF